MKNSRVHIFTSALLLAQVCTSALYAQDSLEPVKVELRQNDGDWSLYRDGHPYYIKGVGGQVFLDEAVALGANSIRTWGAPEAIEVLDEAHAKGLSVLFGLWVGCERQGFDYTDSRAVAAQLAYFTEIVKTYKDHPAILMWGIGNEVDLFYSDFKVWNAINDIAQMIHEVDPNHPTMTVTAGLDVAEVHLIQQRAPHIDVLGINTYGDLLGTGERLRAFGWEKPYIIAEWGPNGHWEVPKTTWGAPVEQTSTEKAASYALRYREGIAQDSTMCIGSYVFLWGQKQETTPTWYGLFLEDSSSTAVLDELHKAWRGSYPSNRAPAIHSFTINGKDRYASLVANAGTYVDVAVSATDPEGGALQYRWELLPESTDIKSGGDKESRPAAVPIEVKEDLGNGRISLRMPKTEGPYRLFVYVYDEQGQAATANFPVFAEHTL